MPPNATNLATNIQCSSSVISIRTHPVDWHKLGMEWATPVLPHSWFPPLFGCHKLGVEVATPHWLVNGIPSGKTGITGWSFIDLYKQPTSYPLPRTIENQIKKDIDKMLFLVYGGSGFMQGRISSPETRVDNRRRSGTLLISGCVLIEIHKVYVSLAIN